jgi:PAS domain S-box-containing protein
MAVDQDKIATHHTVPPGLLDRIVRSPRFVTALEFIAFEIAYLLAFRLATSFGPGSFSPLWFPSSILLCALLKNSPERWWLFIAGTVPVRILGQPDPDFPLWLALVNVAIDIAKALMAAIPLRHFMRDPLRLDTLRDFAIFALFAVLLVPALAAFAGASVRAAVGDDFWSIWGRWFISDALTQLVLTPPILYWVFAAPWSVKPANFGRLIEPVLIAAGLLLSGYWCMVGGSTTTFAETRFYASIPFMFWAALRFGMAGASGAVAVTAAFMVFCAFMRDGPFSGEISPDDTALDLQNFLFLRTAPLYLIAALMEQRNAAERALKASERRFRSMADNSPVLIWMSGPDKLGIFFNQGWLKFTGRKIEQELGEGWIDGVHPDDRQHCLDVCHNAFDLRRPFEVEYRLRRHDGEYRWVFDKGIPRLAEDGEFLGYIGSVLDITDRKGAEESNRALAHVQRLAIIGELTAAVAHELRQPSAAIMSNAEAALALLDSGETPSGEVREIINDIKHANLRANEVLGRIQDFLRKRDAPMEPLDFHAAVVSDVLWLAASDARKRHVRIRTDLSDALPAVVGNRTQLQQVLLNLIVNAMDAMSNTPEGNRQITLRTRLDHDGHVAVTVADCGSGVASRDLPRLFESFFTTRSEGMGLGLSIARSIVETHRGRIWAANNESGGATFHFIIPAAQHETAIGAQGR